MIFEGLEDFRWSLGTFKFLSIFILFKMTLGSVMIHFYKKGNHPLWQTQPLAFEFCSLCVISYFYKHESQRSCDSFSFQKADVSEVETLHYFYLLSESRDLEILLHQQTEVWELITTTSFRMTLAHDALTAFQTSGAKNLPGDHLCLGESQATQIQYI